MTEKFIICALLTKKFIIEALSKLNFTQHKLLSNDTRKKDSIRANYDIIIYVKTEEMTVKFKKRLD